MSGWGLSKTVSHEKKIGITKRATPLTSTWSGDLRTRFTDFQVNEIGEDGNVVHLRSIGTVEKKTRNEDTASSKAKEEESNDNRQSESAPHNSAHTPHESSAQIPDTDKTLLANLAGQIFTDQLVQLFEGAQSNETDNKATVKSDAFDDKLQRGKIHQEIRRIFSSKIATTTTDSGEIVAKAVKSRGAARMRGRGGQETHGGPPRGQYLHFTLYKENKDTLEAVNVLSRTLKLRPQVIGYAGTKDRRAATSQRCSIRYVNSNALAGLNGKLRGMTTGDYEYQADSINLGFLQGNEFTITVKNCQFLDDVMVPQTSEKLEAMRTSVQSALDHMNVHGWINYFGHQRFGTYKIGTHEIGKLIIAGNYEDAVNMILSYDLSIAERAEIGEEPTDAHTREENNRHRACMLFRTDENVDEALRIMPRKCSAETTVLRHLTKSGRQSRRDFAGAIVSITRGLRSMFLHAYQSFVWNHLASRRWELYGEKVIKGDLVLAENGEIEAAGKVESENDDIIHPGEDDDETTVRARPLSEEEASSGRFTIHDIVLPTPGYDVIYPDNEIGLFYEEFMGREENGSLSPHKMRRMRREFSLPGTYRKVMAKFLTTPSVEFKLYSDDTEQMHPTDMDLIKEQEQASRKRRHEDSSDSRPIEKRTKIEDEATGTEEQITAGTEGEQLQEAANGDKSMDGPMETETEQPTKIAAVLKFQLGKSAYATVALRELMGDPPEGKDEGDAGDEV